MNNIDVKDENGGKIGELRKESASFSGGSRYGIHDRYGGKVGQVRVERDYEREAIQKVGEIGAWSLFLIFPIVWWLITRFPLVIAIVLVIWGRIIQTQPYDGGMDSAAYAPVLYVSAVAFWIVQLAKWLGGFDNLLGGVRTLVQETANDFTEATKVDDWNRKD